MPCRHLRQSRHATWFAYLLACVVVLSQSLALAHRVVHAQPDGARALFGQHQAGDKDCKLFDELTGGLALPAAPVLAVAVAPALVPCTPMAAQAACVDVAAYRARAPPRG